MVYVLPTVESLGMILKFYPLEFRCDWSFLHLVIPRLLGILCKIDVFFSESHKTQIRLLSQSFEGVDQKENDQSGCK